MCKEVNIQLIYSLISLITLLTCQPQSNQKIVDCAEQLFVAQQSKQVPPQALDCIAGRDVNKAYQVQTALVNKIISQKTIFGFKAGLTTPVAQQNFNVSHPVAGVLFTEGRRDSGDTIFFSDYQRLRVETELGYYLNKEIDEKIGSVQELSESIQFVLPVLEFPNAAFGEDPSVYDIISANAGSSFYITGEKYPFQNFDLNNLTVNLHHRTPLMNTGKGSDSLGIWTKFRMFSTRNGQILLNGKPIFLRGIAINPPGRGIPTEVEESREFALEYVRFMKSIHVNIIRFPDQEIWYDVCDEQGMMVFGGNYSATVKGEIPSKNYDKGVEWFKHTKFQPIIHHTCI